MNKTELLGAKFIKASFFPVILFLPSREFHTLPILSCLLSPSPCLWSGLCHLFPGLPFRPMSNKLEEFLSIPSADWVTHFSAKMSLSYQCQCQCVCMGRFPHTWLAEAGSDPMISSMEQPILGTLYLQGTVLESQKAWWVLCFGFAVSGNLNTLKLST